MPSLPRSPRSGRRASASLGLLAFVVGLGGCFEDHVMFDDDGGPAATTDEPDPGSTTVQPGSTSEAESGDTGTEPAESTGAMAEESTGGPGDSGSTGHGEDSGSSTGAMQDESSTGSEPALGVDELQPGDLVITEVMWNPHCGGDACEWIEILNTTDSPVNLLDLYVQDIDVSASNQGRVTVDLVVEPGAVAVITRGVSFWPYDFEPGAVYGPNPGFNNDQPEAVVIRNSTAVLDETAVFFLEVEEGVAWMLSGASLDAVSNDNAGSWCGASTVLPTVSTTEFGTPGVINESCAS
jgi:hypothetical protein